MTTATATATTATATTAVEAAIATALSKGLADKSKALRSDLPAGTYEVDETVTLRVKGTVKVGEDYDSILAQKAKPWNLFATLLGEVNKERAAAGMAGVDLKRLVEMAEALDKDAAKDAEKAANAEIAKIKAPTRRTCKGRVTTKVVVEAA
jgi:hypothetical protein